MLTRIDTTAPDQVPIAREIPVKIKKLHILLFTLR
jgi:hypothetical protein